MRSSYGIVFVGNLLEVQVSIEPHTISIQHTNPVWIMMKLQKNVMTNAKPSEYRQKLIKIT